MIELRVLTPEEMAEVEVHIPWSNRLLNPLRERHIVELDAVEYLPPPILRWKEDGTGLKTADGRHRVTRLQRRKQGGLVLICDRATSHHFDTSVTTDPPVMA